MSEERESLGLVAYNYEPEFTEEEMLRFHRRGESKFALISNTIFGI
jgi:hypothetical protein